MTIEILKSKIKDIKVTATYINRGGVIKMTKELMSDANIRNYEKVLVFNDDRNQRTVAFVEEYKTPRKDKYEITAPISIAGAHDSITIMSMVRVSIDNHDEHNPIVIDRG